MSKNNAACADGRESPAVCYNACSDSSGSIIACTAHNDSACFKTCKLSYFFCDNACYFAGFIYLCEHRHINAKLVADLLAPAAVRNIKELHSRCIGNLGGILTCEHKSYVILWEKNVAASCVIFRLLVLYPKDLCGSPACKSRVCGYLDKLFPADFLVHFLDFIGSSLIAPDDRLSDDLIVFIEHNKSVHLS